MWTRRSIGFVVGFGGFAVACSGNTTDTDETDERNGAIGAVTQGADAGGITVADGSTGVTIGPLANDGVKNGDESDVDCGGTAAPKCPAGKSCAVANDCSDGTCSSGTCVEASGHDGVRNGDETDIDCGGQTTPGCAPGKACNDGPQCDSDVCILHKCQAPTHDDGTTNGDETDIDCGGSCGPCGDGQSCNGNDDCQSGACGGGVCEPKGGPTLQPGNCAAAMVGVDAAFAGAIMGNCGCHGGGSGGLTFSDAASFKAATVNIKASKADMNRITPGNIDESYLLYKVHGQQGNAPGGGGGQMPLNGMKLADDKLCLLINWVKSIK